MHCTISIAIKGAIDIYMNSIAPADRDYRKWVLSNEENYIDDYDRYDFVLEYGDIFSWQRGFQRILLNSYSMNSKCGAQEKKWREKGCCKNLGNIICLW